jgi:hypothetical protein
MGCDGYIDDLVTVAVDKNDNLRKAQNAGPIAVHALFRPVNLTDKIPRDDAVSQRKLSGEGTPCEQKVVLGWLLCTRSFRVFLPVEKAHDWLSTLRLIVELRTVDADTIEQVIGRLNHTGYILSTGRYFINRFRHLHKRCVKFGTQHLNNSEMEDVKLWIDILLFLSDKGVSINNISFVQATVRLWTDASEHGIGGHDDHGVGWRLELPLDLQGLFSINLLEFVGSYIGVVVAAQHHPTKYLRIMAYTDSSSALGWLYKASFNPVTQEAHNHVARTLARFLINNEMSLYSQHIPCKQNIIADSLSRDFHITGTKLTFLLNNIFNPQTQGNLRLVALSSEITCFLYSLKALSTNRKEYRVERTPSSLGRLIDGADLLKDVVSKTNSWINLRKKNEHVSCPHLRQVLEGMSTAKQTRHSYAKELSVPPLATFVRPSGRTFGMTHLEKRVESKAFFSNAK